MTARCTCGVRIEWLPDKRRWVHATSRMVRCAHGGGIARPRVRERT